MIAQQAKKRLPATDATGAYNASDAHTRVLLRARREPRSFSFREVEGKRRSANVCHSSRFEERSRLPKSSGTYKRGVPQVCGGLREEALGLLEVFFDLRVGVPDDRKQEVQTYPADEDGHAIKDEVQKNQIACVPLHRGGNVRTVSSVSK
eukprot:1195993-Prorocentrum_minimum.AAC.7